MTTTFYDSESQPIPSSRLLGYGERAVVYQSRNQAIKVPRRHSITDSDHYHENIVFLRREQTVYQNFQSCFYADVDRIVRPLEFYDQSTYLELMPGGNLHDYVRTQPQQPPHVQLRWFCQMAQAVSQAHKQGVIVGDVSASNFLFDKDGTLKMCGFSHACIFWSRQDMDTADGSDRSVTTDIGELGAVICGLVMEKETKYDLNKGVVEDGVRLAFRQNFELPITNGMWLGVLIRRCWSREYKDAEELVNELTNLWQEAEDRRFLNQIRPGALAGVADTIRQTVDASINAVAPAIGFVGVLLFFKWSSGRLHDP